MLNFLKNIFGGNRLERLQKKADGMENSPEKMAILQEIVEIVDKQGNVEAQFNARVALHEAATSDGTSAMMIELFDWLLVQIDTYDGLEWWTVLWMYKWHIWNLANNYDTPLAELKATIDDYERRLEAIDESLRPVHHLRRGIALPMGRHDVAQEEFAHWKQSPEGNFADCAACEIDTEVDYYIYLGDDEQALKTAGPLLMEQMGCSEVPHLTFARVLKPLMRLGRMDRAEECHKKGWPMIEGRRFGAEVAPLHLLYLTRIGDFDRGAKILDGMLAMAANMNTQYSQMLIYDGIAIFLERAAAAGQFPRNPRLPDKLATFSAPLLDTPNPLVDVSPLKGDPQAMTQWFRAEADAAAELFDRRNGNTFCSEQLAANVRLVDAG